MPAANKFEVEVKTLLGDQAGAEAFIAKLRQADDGLKLTGGSSQLNHYFDDRGDPTRLSDAVTTFLAPDDLAAFRQILSDAGSFALRTRQDIDPAGKPLLVIKAAAREGGDSQHALERIEGEYETAAADIDALDRAIQDAGYGFLSKWSRQRRTYRYKDFTVTIDRNAGYGHIAEIEQVVSDRAAAAAARERILTELAGLGAEELSQERVGRMFEHYNRHWPEYYRTEKTFVVE